MFIFIKAIILLRHRACMDMRMGAYPLRNWLCRLYALKAKAQILKNLMLLLLTKKICRRLSEIYLKYHLRLVSVKKGCFQCKEKWKSFFYQAENRSTKVILFH